MTASTVRDGLPAEVRAALGQLDTILLLAGMADVDALRQALDALNRFDSIGHVLDPTAYIRGADARKNDGRLLHAFLAFRKTIEDVRSDVERELTT